MLRIVNQRRQRLLDHFEQVKGDPLTIEQRRVLDQIFFLFTSQNLNELLNAGKFTELNDRLEHLRSTNLDGCLKWSVDEQTAHNKTLLHHAVIEGNLLLVLFLLRMPKMTTEVLNQKEARTNFTALHLACFTSSLEVLTALLTTYAVARNERDVDDNNAVLLSLTLPNKLQFTELLLTHGCSAEIFTAQDHCIPLHFLCAQNLSNSNPVELETALRVLHLLHDCNKIDILHLNLDGDSAVHICIAYNNFDLFCEIIQMNKAAVDIANHTHFTPLFMTVDPPRFITHPNIERTRFAKVLLQNGADFEKVLPHIDWSPLMYSLQVRIFSDVVENTTQLLIDAGANLFKLNKTGICPLLLCLESGATRFLKLIIERNDGSVDLNKRLGKFDFPIEVACYRYVSNPRLHKDFSTIDLLVASGAKIETPDLFDNYSNTEKDPKKLDKLPILMYLLLFERSPRGLGLVKHLIKLGADCSLRFREESITPLIIAICIKDLEIVKLLLSHGANLDDKFEISLCKKKPVHNIIEDVAREGSQTCDICMKYLKKGEVFKRCTEKNCNIYICKDCMFVDNAKNLTAIDFAKRMNNPMIFNLVNFARSFCGRKLIKVGFFEQYENVFRNANVLQKEFCKKMSEKDLKKLGIRNEEVIDKLLVVFKEN